jgi:hypothetical protein
MRPSAEWDLTDRFIAEQCRSISREKSSTVATVGLPAKRCFGNYDLLGMGRRTELADNPSGLPCLINTTSKSDSVSSTR